MSSAIGMTGGIGANSINATGSPSMKKMGGYQNFKLPNFTPEQMQLFQSMFSQVGPQSFLSKLAGGDQSQFEQLEAPALKQFQGLQGDIASRFSGMGMGGRRSSGFQNTINQASSDFAQQLQSNRMSLQRQALMDLMGMSESLLGQRPYEQFVVPKQQKEKSFLQQLLLGLSGGASGGSAFGLGKLFNNS